ncbi:MULTISPECIES: GlsB/YeaQ/YmgE family stress response membrane protein [Alkalibacillus]
MELIILIIVGGLIGWAGGLLIGGTPGGIIGNIIVGFIGAWIGHGLFGTFGPEVAGFAIFPAILGAMILVAILSLIMKIVR